MGSIPVIASLAGGAVGTTTHMNQIKAVSDFWANAPGVYAFQVAAQSIPNNVGTALNFDGEVYDIVQSGDTPSHDLSTNNTRLVCRTAGKYDIVGQAQTASNATGIRAAQVRLNAAGSVASGTLLSLAQQPPLSGASTSVSITPIRVALAVGDYVELFVTQTSGGALNTVAGQGVTFLRMDLVRS